MFGLDKKGPAVFDLEADLTGPQRAEKAVEIKKFISERIEVLKDLLRKESDKKNFENNEILLHGYMAFQKVVEKILR